MARTVAQIQQQMYEAKLANTNLDGLTSSSQVAIWRLWIFIVASAIAVFEQLQDLFKTELETIAQSARAGTEEWMQAQVFKFQYSATNPQALVFEDFAPTYPTIDTTLQIVTRCSVITDLNKDVSVKVAKSEPPAPLTTPEYNSLYGYLLAIRFAGVSFNLISADSDKVSVSADVYVDAQYFSVIQTNVEAAINLYLKNTPFDGKIKVSEIENAIQSVTGVKDVKLNYVKGRRDSVAIGSANVIYDLSTSTNVRYYASYAGYLVEETTPSYTFADTITYISQ